MRRPGSNDEPSPAAAGPFGAAAYQPPAAASEEPAVQAKPVPVVKGGDRQALTVGDLMRATEDDPEADPLLHLRGGR